MGSHNKNNNCKLKNVGEKATQKLWPLFFSFQKPNKKTKPKPKQNQKKKKKKNNNNNNKNNRFFFFEKTGLGKT